MARVLTHTPGFPRIGAQRELPAALEAFGRGDISATALQETAAKLRERHWTLQTQAGLDFVTVGDFALHDQVADHAALFGCAVAPGQARWFDTGYHYQVPQFAEDTGFTLHAQSLLDQVVQARALGHAVKAVVIGPLTFLWLGRSISAGHERLDLLERLLPAYCALLAQLKSAGAEWVQVDEPILGLDLPPAWRNAFEPCYWQLGQAGAQLMLATYFSPLEENLSLACRLPVAGLHVDGVRARHELVNVCDWLPVPKILSVGIVDGRNVWRTDLDQAISIIEPLLARRGGEIWLAPSCSLLHVPLTLDGEDGMSAEVRSWLAFATEKLGELATLKAALSGAGAQAGLAAARAAIAARARSALVYNEAVASAVTGLPPDDGSGHAPCATGAAPSHAAIEQVGALLQGVAATRNGWVQSHGAHCVRPPIIYGDVARAGAASTGDVLTGPVTIVQSSFVREDQPRALTALQIALALRPAALGPIAIHEPALRDGLPLRRSRHDDYLAWATRALRVTAGAAAA